ncbi:hypothetical protein BH09BAC2_BH09BAC2_09240 [soil metagenome]
MKKIFAIAFSVCFCIIISAFRFTGDSLPIGSTLPLGDVKMKNINNALVSMHDAKKQNGLLVIFSCNTCPYVIKNQERMKAICNYALQQQIGVIVLNSNEAQRNDDDSFDAMKTYATQQSYSWFYTVDVNSTIADTFGAKRTPECFLFNKQLKLTYHGAIDDNPTEPDNVTRQHLREAISQQATGSEITIKESRSVGCGIKRKG